MSRIGRASIQLPDAVTVVIAPAQVTVTGPKGTMTVPVVSGISVVQNEKTLEVSRAGDERQSKANHGLVRSLLNNAVLGVVTPFTITLKLVGVGYRVQAKGAGLSMTLGFSHPIEIPAQAGITFVVEGNDTIKIAGIDKHAVGQIAANIRSYRPPEPYKGKGIRYEDESVRRKQGKASA